MQCNSIFCKKWIWSTGNEIKMISAVVSLLSLWIVLNEVTVYCHEHSVSILWTHDLIVIEYLIVINACVAVHFEEKHLLCVNDDGRRNRSATVMHCGLRGKCDAGKFPGNQYWLSTPTNRFSQQAISYAIQIETLNSR